MKIKLQRQVALSAAAAALLSSATVLADAAQTSAVKIGSDAIGGVVAGPGGPEAGVWVIAQTDALPTRFARIVVTDEQGRYLVPDLPKAQYSVWVRGYGLVDSAKVRGTPGQTLNLSAVPAPTAADAARYYPAISWFSLLSIPGKEQFGGKSAIPAYVTQQQYIRTIKNDCTGCHQLGSLATRTLPAEFAGMTGVDAWVRRLSSGQAAPFMIAPIAGQLGGVPYRHFAAWTDSIKQGALPGAAPPRPQGVERNVVITEWDWATPTSYLHDLISTDRRNPTVNAYGPLYGSTEYSTDTIPILDPRTHTASQFNVPLGPTAASKLGGDNVATEKPLMPSAYWGDEQLWTSHINNHNGMFDASGRVWFAAAGRGPDTPDFCKDPAKHPAAVFPIKQSNRGLSVFEPKSGKYTFIDTCFETHHLQFGSDADEMLYTSMGAGPVLGWLNSRKFATLLAQTGNVATAAAAAQGWTPFVVDTSGDGKRSDFVAPDQPVQPGKDKRIDGGMYAVMPSPADGSVWGTFGVFYGSEGVVRVSLGNDPPRTALTEFYHVPLPGFGPRGGDIDSKGVVWVSLRSGHLASFDRRKCKGHLNGPQAANGDLCQEGWSFYQYPGPGFAGIGTNSAEASYYTWVDQHGTFGLGPDVPISTGNENDALLALKDGKWVILRVPYPLNFYAKGLDGRIDDPKAGWKGRGLWTTSGDRAPWHHEGGKGSRPKVFHFQIRPNPLAD